MEVVMLIGIPGSGKSSVAEPYIERGYKLHSSDAIRKELYGSEEIQGKASEVFSLLAQRIQTDLRQNASCVMDATNLSRKRRCHQLRTLQKFPCKKTCLIVLASPDTCLERNEQRLRHVPAKRIHDMVCSFETPYYYEGWDQIKVSYSGNPYVFPRADVQEMSQDNPYHTLSLGGHLDAARDYCEANKFAGFLQEAAWYHDIGKLYTKSFMNRKGEPQETAHYYGHENYGAYLYLCEKISKSDQTDTWDEILYIANLINWHMRPLNAWQKSPEREAKDRALMGEDMYQDILRLNRADRQAGSRKDLSG